MLLALGLLALSACSQEARQSEPQPTVQQPTEQGSLALSAQALSSSFEDEETARAIEFDLGKKGAMTDPKFKGLTAGSKFLCIIRSSNPAQPINYIQMAWKQEAGDSKKFYIEQKDGHFPFSFTPGQSLGNLSMMIVVGGTWDATSKRLTFDQQITQVTTSAGRETATLDVPYFSAWMPLDIEDPTPQYLKVKLRGYTRGSATEKAVFALQPQGMLLRMRVENEMVNTNNTTRNLRLNKLHIRSTAYSGSGYYDLSENAVRTGATKATETRNAQLLPWTASDSRAYKQTDYDLSASPLSLPYNATGRTAYNRYGLVGRTFYHYPNSPWLLCWVKPTGQSPTDVGKMENDEYKVRTEIFAEVEDTRTNTVTSNTPGVDREEASGKILVPSMKALPAYYSRKLTVKSGRNVAFVNGAAYRITLNLQRTPMVLDLLSEEALKQDGRNFDEGNYNNVGYFNAQNLKTEANIKKNLPITASGNWVYPPFGTLATVMGTSTGSSFPLMSLVPRSYAPKNPPSQLYPFTIEGIGNYAGEVGFAVRAGQAFTMEEKNGRIIVYTILFYPSKAGGNPTVNNSQLNADHLSVVKYEYGGVHNGITRTKMTQRYLGSYSSMAHLDETQTDRSKLGDLMITELKHLIALGDAYWNDELLKQDDVVRYFPLLGYRLPDGSARERGTTGYLGLGYIDNRLDYQGSAEFSPTFLLHRPRGSNPYDDGKEYYPIRLVRPDFK